MTPTNSFSWQMLIHDKWANVRAIIDNVFFSAFMNNNQDKEKDTDLIPNWELKLAWIVDLWKVWDKYYF